MNANGLAAALRSIEVQEHSQDQDILVLLKGGRRMAVSMRPRAFEHYQESQLLAQFNPAVNRLWRKHLESVDSLLRAAGVLPVRDSSFILDGARRRYREALDRAEFKGVSERKLLRVRCAGMTDFRFELRPGSKSALRSDGFEAEAASAFAALIRDRAAKTLRLKARHFDLGAVRSAPSN